MTKQDILRAFTTTNEQNEVVSFDFATFDTLVSDLVSERASLRKTNKEAIKQQKEAQNEVLAEAGKKFYTSLNVGDEFQYKMADGTVITARKIQTKSGANNSAACEVVSGMEIKAGKSALRYPKFHTLVIAA